MKNFIKGFRFTPSNYPAAVEDKIQKYRKQGYKLPPRKVLRTPNNWKEYVKVPKSTLHYWIISRRISVRECLPRKLTD